MKTLKELQVLTLAWSDARGITTNGKPVTQVCKLTEEVCETLVAIMRTDINEIRDGLGDSLVVCCNLGKLINSSISFNKLKSLSDNVYRIEQMLYSLGKLNKTINAGKFEEADAWLQELVIALYSTANYFGYTPEECWSAAYETIKDRKGYLTPEGNFIKESDL